MKQIGCPACLRGGKYGSKLRRLPRIPNLSEPGQPLSGKYFMGCDVCGAVIELVDIQIGQHQITALERYYQVYRAEKAKIRRYKRILAVLNLTGEPPSIFDTLPKDDDDMIRKLEERKR